MTLSRPIRKRTVYVEDVLQEHCVIVFRMKWPDIIIHHSPNGGKRGALEAMRFQRMGTTAGWPDLQIPVPSGSFHGLFIELKSEKGRLTDKQEAMIEKLRRYGYRVEVCRSVEEFLKVCTEYFSLKSDTMREEEE